MAIISKLLDPGADTPPLASFALAWRWHAAGRHPLPPATLAQLRVLPAPQARAAFRVSGALLQAPDGSEGLDCRGFSRVQRDTAASSDAQVTAWLRGIGPGGGTRVWLSWEPELALCTRWGVFVRHWRAFCYPGSDELVVFPASLRWALFHHHAQRIEFGRMAAANGGVSENAATILTKASGVLQDTAPHAAG